MNNLNMSQDVRIDLNKGTKLTCKCGGNKFELYTYYEVYKFSKLITNLPEDRMATIPFEKFKCVECGEILKV